MATTYTLPNSEPLSPPRLRAVLAARSMTFARLAHSLNVSERYLLFVVTGQRKSAALIQALRRFFGDAVWGFVTLQSHVLDLSESAQAGVSGHLPESTVQR